LLGERFPVSEGDQLRDFCYVSDVVSAVFAAMARPKVDGEIFNVGSGPPVKIKKVVQTVRDHVGRGDPEFGAVALRRGENPALFADITKAKSRLKWEPKMSFDAGLIATIGWYARKLEITR